MHDTTIRRVRQSGVIPWRIDDRGLQVALVTSSSGRSWLVPKGHLEPDMTPAASAAKEAWEEAGLEGRVSSHPVGAVELVRGNVLKCVRLYTMAVTRIHDTWPEMHRRSRRWVAPRVAAELVSNDDLADCILAMGRRLGAAAAA